MEIWKYAAIFIVGLVTIMILDYIWLGIITKNFIIQEFKNLIVIENGSIKINLLAGIIAWSVITLLVLIFVVFRFEWYRDIILYSALMWFLSYAMYDLTNLTFITNYSLKFTLVDIAWGTFLCTMIWINSYAFYQFIK